MDGTHHPQARVEYKGQYFPIDEELADMMPDIWDLGIRTSRSCQEHPTGKVWIEMDGAHVPTFVNAVAPRSDENPDLYQRVGAWEFSTFQVTSVSPLVMNEADKAKSWEYHATLWDGMVNPNTGERDSPESAFRLLISVLFPRSDLESVKKALKKAAMATPSSSG